MAGQLDGGGCAMPDACSEKDGRYGVHMYMDTWIAELEQPNVRHSLS